VRDVADRILEMEDGWIIRDDAALPARVAG
jgi:hypothetical protein